VRIARSYAFVVPRYGRAIAGGAETLVANLATRVAARGDRVEVWTTCARDNRSWANEFPAGTTVEDGVTVRRFPVDARDLERWIPRQIQINDGMALPLEDQLEWMSESVNSGALYEHIEAHGASFDALFFAPYLFGTTFWGSLIHPQRSYLIPCLHDEHYAYTEVIQSMFRQVAGALFNAAPERDLARSLYGDIAGGEVGMGFEPVPEEEIRELTPFFSEGAPYLLYVGRKETGKNVQLLIDYFTEGKRARTIPESLRLVIAGAGSFEDLHRPGALTRDDIVDLVHVSEEEKRRLIRHAVALCQPSTNESFSIVIMEAWLLGIPVMVHAKCPVTRHHAIESGGGLYFSDAADFGLVVGELMSNEPLRRAMGESGCAYVRRRYDWAAVLGRFDAVVEDLLTRREAA